MGGDMFGFREYNMSDHEFARYLNSADSKWTWTPLKEYNQFWDSKGKILAVVKYKNDYPVARKIFLPLPGVTAMVNGFRKMTNDCDYYDKELGRVLPKKGEIVSIQIKNGDTGKTTKWLSLNLDSIVSLQAFIDIIKEDLK